MDVTYQQIQVDRQGAVCLITLNRPEKLNAWTRQMDLELIEAVSAANQDRTIGAIVVTGAGRGFCAGADIAESFQQRLENDEPQQLGEGEEAVSESRVNWVDLVRDSKPMIAAINGVAVGVGITMVLPFDVLLASDVAKIGMFFVRMGLVPELGSSHFLVQRVGLSMASEMCLTGKLYTATELEGTGLLNRVLPEHELLPTALEMAATIAGNPEPSLRFIKQLLTANGSETDLGIVQARELEALNEAYLTPEHKEAVAAFMEKRAPNFGRG